MKICKICHRAIYSYEYCALFVKEKELGSYCGRDRYYPKTKRIYYFHSTCIKTIYPDIKEEGK